MSLKKKKHTYNIENKFLKNWVMWLLFSVRVMTVTFINTMKEIEEIMQLGFAM